MPPSDTGPFGHFLNPWYSSLEDPLMAQEQTLRVLLEGYAKTIVRTSPSSTIVGSWGSSNL